MPLPRISPALKLWQFWWNKPCSKAVKWLSSIFCVRQNYSSLAPDWSSEFNSLSFCEASKKRFFDLRLSHSPKRTIEAKSIPTNTSPIFLPHLIKFIQPSIARPAKNYAFPAIWARPSLTGAKQHHHRWYYIINRNYNKHPIHPFRRFALWLFAISPP